MRMPSFAPVTTAKRPAAMMNDSLTAMAQAWGMAAALVQFCGNLLPQEALAPTRLVPVIGRDVDNEAATDVGDFGVISG